MAVYLGDDEVGVCIKKEITVTPPHGAFLVRVIDFDGTVIDEVWLNTNDTYTLPAAPSHTGLTFQSWSSPVSISNGKITVTDQSIIIGATYTTTSGLSEFDFEITVQTGLAVTLNMNGTKDWGDGTTDSATSHTYSNYGSYTVKCDGTSMTTSSSSGIFGQASGSINYYCKAVRLSTITYIGSYAFQYCYSLSYITIPTSVSGIYLGAFKYSYSLDTVIFPSSVTLVDESTFAYCYSLRNLVVSSGIIKFQSSCCDRCYSLQNISIPANTIRVAAYSFEMCYSLKTVKLPASISKVESYLFRNNYSIRKVDIPSSVTQIESNSFNGCAGIKSFKFPAGLTSIQANAFNNCYGTTLYDFSDATAIPTLANSNAFSGINKSCKIVVPDSLYASWRATSPWSTYANYIYKKSQVFA